jgi:ABC-type phosphate/phosphonate transport system ATPase subunit
MASKLVGIVGATGTGKSTSIKHLNPEETYIINVAKKELPFKGSEKLYNTENKNYKEIDDANEISRLLKTISEKAPHIKQVILEDSNYVMGFTMLDKATEKGYEKFSLMAKDTVTMIRTAKQLRDDLTAAITEIEKVGTPPEDPELKVANEILFKVLDNMHKNKEQQS